MAAQAILDTLLADMLELLECDDDDGGDDEDDPSGDEDMSVDGKQQQHPTFKLGHADIEGYLSREGFNQTLEAYSNDRKRREGSAEQQDTDMTTTLTTITRKARAWDTARVKIQKLIDTCTQLANQGSPTPVTPITPSSPSKAPVQDIEEGELDRLDVGTQTDDIPPRIIPKVDVGLSTSEHRQSYVRDAGTYTLDDGVIQEPKMSIPLRRSSSRTSPPASSTSAAVSKETAERGTSPMPLPSQAPAPQETPKVNGHEETMTRSAKALYLQSKLAAALDSKHLCFSISELRALAKSPPSSHIAPPVQAHLQPSSTTAAAAAAAAAATRHVSSASKESTLPNGHSPAAATTARKAPIQLGQVYAPSSASPAASTRTSNASTHPPTSKDKYQTTIESASASASASPAPAPAPATVNGGATTTASATASPTVARPYPAPLDPRRARQQQQQQRNSFNTQPSAPSVPASASASTSQEPLFQSPIQNTSTSQLQEASTSVPPPAAQAQASAQSPDPKDPPPSIMDLVPEYLKNRPKGRQPSIDVKKSTPPSGIRNREVEMEASSLASSDADGESDDMDIEEQSPGEGAQEKQAEVSVAEEAVNTAAVDSFLDDVAGDMGPSNDGADAGVEEHLPSSQELEHLFDETIPEPAPNLNLRSAVQASISPIPPSTQASTSSTSSTHQAKDRILSMFAKKPTTVPPRPVPSLQSNIRLSTSKPIAVASRTVNTIDKERARLLHEETTMRMARQREAMARNAEIANRRLMEEKEKLNELIRASNQRNEKAAHEEEEIAQREEEEVLEEAAAAEVTDTPTIEDPPSISANLAIMTDTEAQTEISATRAQASVDTLDAAAKAISREAELKRRLKRQRLPSDSEASEVPAKKAAIARAVSPLAGQAVVSAQAVVSRSVSPVPARSIPLDLEVPSNAQQQVEIANSQQTAPASESAQDHAPVFQQPPAQAASVTVQGEPPIASTSKLPSLPPSAPRPKAKPKHKVLIPVVEIPYKKVDIPPPKMVKKKKLVKRVKPVDSMDMGHSEAHVSVKEASSSPELAPPTGLEGNVGASTKSAPTPAKTAPTPDIAPAAKATPAKTPIAVIDISDDSDEDADVPSQKFTAKGKESANATPSKPPSNSRVVESLSSEPAAITAQAPQLSNHPQAVTSTTPTLLSRAEAQQKLAEQVYPYITIYKLDLAAFTAKGIKVDEGLLREHFGMHRSQTILQDNTAWYATFPDSNGAAGAASLLEDKLLLGLEVPLQVDEPPTSQKSAVPALSVTQPASSESRVQAPTAPITSAEGSNDSVPEVAPVPKHATNSVTGSSMIDDNAAQAVASSMTEEHQSLSKSASVRLEKSIDELLAENRPAAASSISSAQKTAQIDKPMRVMSSQSPEPDELVEDVEMAGEAAQLSAAADKETSSADSLQKVPQAALNGQLRHTVMDQVEAQQALGPEASLRLLTPEEASPAKAASPAPSTSTEEPPSGLRVGQAAVSTYYKPLGAMIGRDHTPGPARVSASDLMSPARDTFAYPSLSSAGPPAQNKTPTQTPMNTRVARDLTYESPASATGTVRSEDSIEIIMATPRSFLPDRPLEEPVSKCKFSTGCINMLCKFAHPSSSAPRNSNLPTTSRKCPDEALCREPDCHLSHPSPAARRNEICPNQDNCPLGAKCAFRHVDQGRSALIRRPYQSHNQSAIFTNPPQQTAPNIPPSINQMPYSQVLPPRQAVPMYSTYTQAQPAQGQPAPAAQPNVLNNSQQANGGGVFGYLSSSTWNPFGSRRAG